MLSFSFWKALSSSGPHMNGACSFNLLIDAVRGEYRGKKFERYPIMPRKLLTSSLDLGGLHSFTALAFSSVGLSPSSVNL